MYHSDSSMHFFSSWVNLLTTDSRLYFVILIISQIETEQRSRAQDTFQEQRLSKKKKKTSLEYILLRLKPSNTPQSQQQQCMNKLGGSVCDKGKSSLNVLVKDDIYFFLRVQGILSVLNIWGKDIKMMFFPLEIY